MPRGDEHRYTPGREHTPPSGSHYRGNVNSSNLPLSRPSIWRDALTRLDSWDEILRHPLQVLTVAGGRIEALSDQLALRFSPTLNDHHHLLIYLGQRDGSYYLAQVVDQDASDNSLNLREVGWKLDGTEASLATTALALANWHDRQRYCAQCGAPTEPAEAGWVERCTREGNLHFPRTDPAMIVAVIDPDDRLLLAHNAAWPQGRYSLSAGFIEPGESLEASVIREVREETGLDVTDVTYVSSQPWPFPVSLMFGCQARAISTDIKVDGVEISDARWVRREDLVDMVQAGELTLPQRTSIARHLIEEWYGAELPQATVALG